jgi:hypothetical protein
VCDTSRHFLMSFYVTSQHSLVIHWHFYVHLYDKRYAGVWPAVLQEFSTSIDQVKS